MSLQARSRLLELFKQRAFSFGDFTLASGKKSSYYINSKKAIFYSEAVALLGDLLWEATRDLDIQAMGGLEVGAIPMTTAAVMRYHQEGRTLEGFFVRKQAKGHGSQERIEGVLEPGMRCVMVDDVLTTGGSVLQAIEEVEKRGALIQAVVCIVDRLEGARETLAPRYPYNPLFTIRDFGVAGEPG
jgi:orotate phosphoribosyltransferase